MDLSREITPKKTFFNWSSGKDSAMALYQLESEEDLQVEKLLTTINEANARVTMHGIRQELVAQQAKSIGIDIEFVKLPSPASMINYERVMNQQFERLESEEYVQAGYGDINLEDLRNYRSQQLSKFNIEGIYPLWERDTAKLAKEIISAGFKAIVVAIHAGKLDESFLGRTYNQSFLEDLPNNVDPCGENGEFHTFCYNGPIFQQTIPFHIGKKIIKFYPSPIANQGDIGFWFLDLLPMTNTPFL